MQGFLLARISCDDARVAAGDFSVGGDLRSGRRGSGCGRTEVITRLGLDQPRDIPLDRASHWAPLPRSYFVDRPAFWSANLCFSLGESLPQSPESASATVSSDESGWTAVEVVAHWPGEAVVTDQYASTVYRSLRGRLDHCFNAIGAQVSVTDLTNGHAATVTLPAQGGKQPQYHLYVVQPPGTGTVARQP